MINHLAPLSLAASLLIILSGCAKKEEPQLAEKTKKIRSAKVEPTAQRLFEDRIVIQGTLEAKYYANVSVKIEGVLENILVDEGDTVIKDKTVLFISDTRKPLQNKQVAEQNLLVATEGYNVALANVAKADAQCDKARKDAERYAKLFEKGNVTVNEKETFSTNYIVAEASLKLAKAQAQSAEAQMKQAKVAFEIAARDLDDCTIKAPLTGVVTKRSKEPGEYASKSSPVLRIENPDILEASAFIPGKYFPRIAVGKTTVRLVAEGHDAGTHGLSYRADTIDTMLRTFEIKARFENKDRKFAPGMMTDVTIIMDSRKNISVPSHSIIERQQGFIVYMLQQDSTVKELNIIPGLVNDGFTEIVACRTADDKGTLADFPLTEGIDIISEGQYLLVDKDKVNVAGKQQTPETAAPATVPAPAEN